MAVVSLTGEFAETGAHLGGNAREFFRKAVTSAFDHQQPGSRRDQLQRRSDLLDRSELVARPLHKERRSPERGEVRSPQLRRA